MTEVLIGLGHQRSIRAILAHAEAEIGRIYGSPRRIAAKSSVLDFIAERVEINGDYESITFKIHDSDSAVAALAKADDQLAELFDHTEEGNSHIYSYPRAGGANSHTALEAMDVFAKNMELPEVWHFEGSEFRHDHISIELMFKAMVQYKASDTHLIPGEAPVFRIDNQLRVSELMGALSSEQIERMIQEIAPEAQWGKFQANGQCTFCFHQAGIGYARATAFVMSGAPHLTFRFLPEKVPSFKDLSLDEEMMVALSSLTSGLLIVSGMPGSGKTTTCAAIIDWINSKKHVHILCIEDPIEYIHQNKMAFVSQRELGTDVETFSEGVEGAVHQDPDIIYVGELSDVDTLRAAIDSAATGNLVIGTLQFSNASGIINRIAGYFDPVERDLVRMQLREHLSCVVCQKLIPRAKGGRVPAVEVLFNDTAHIQNSIEDGRTQGIRLGMQQTISQSKLFEHYIHDLLNREVITLETARASSADLSMFEQIHMGTYKVPRLDSN